MKYPTIYPMDCSRGAPMGRSEWHKENVSVVRSVRVFHVPLNSGGYDVGGAYWGLGGKLYCATDCKNFRLFTRARNRAEACETFQKRAKTQGITIHLVKRIQKPKNRIWYGVDKSGELTAFLLDQPANKFRILCYAHIGQHSEASVAYFDECRRATEEESKELRAEVEQIYKDCENITLKNRALAFKEA
jgi:hypothetical protein